MPTTFRATMVAGFGTMMNAYIGLYPTRLVRHFRVRPESFNTDLPCSYLDLRPESVEYTSGTQVRTAGPSLVVVGRPTESGQSADTFDSLVDSLVEYIGGYGGSFGGHITVNSVWSNLTISDETEDDGDGKLPAVRFTFPDLSLTEGRPRFKAAFVTTATATPEQIVNALHAVGLITQLYAVTATAEQLVYALQDGGMVLSLTPATATPEAVALALIAAGIMEAS